MKKNIIVFISVAIILTFFSFKTANNVNIWMIGDSTMANKSAQAAPETGWGMVLHEFVKSNVCVHNHALNGRSSKSFRDEGHWANIYDSIQPGDIVIIQFGHNDEKNDSVRHTDPQTSYKAIIKQYIDASRAKGACPIVCSSIVRRQFDEAGNLKDTHGEYIKAAREIAVETHSIYIDMEALSRKLVTKLGPEKSKSMYLFCKAGEYPNRMNGVEDSTHLNYKGAKLIANLFVKELKNKKNSASKLFK